MAKSIQLTSKHKLPLELATCVTLVAGKRGSGKTNTAKRIVEQAILAGVPVAVLDPADVWHGLRTGAAGDAKGGLPVYVFGGRNADLPLESTAGALLADVVIEQRVSVVMSLRQFSGAARARFIIDFAQRLIQKNTDPILVVCEEAHETMPQDKGKGPELEALGAMLRLVTLGRSSGIGVLQVTQRLARLNKTATTQSDVLIAHRTIGPQDRDALEEWIKYHHAGSHRAEFMEALPAFKTGEAWLWAPDFPEDDPLGLERVKVLECMTFNSHATPKVGETRRQPKALAEVDLEKLKAKMATTIERAKASDPNVLKRRVAELEAEITKLAKVKEKTDKAPKFDIVTAKLVWAHPSYIADVRKRASELNKLADNMETQNAKVAVSKPAREVERVAPQIAPRVQRAPSVRANGASSDLPKGELAVLKVVCQYGEQGATREQITLITGYKTSTRNAYIQRLNERHLVELLNPQGNVCGTDIGFEALGADFEPLPTGDALREHWLGKLPEGERAVLEVAINAYPGTVDRETISDKTGYKTSTRNAYLQRLGVRRLVNVTRNGAVQASGELFD